MIPGSVCTRCGKPRVVKETYEEKVETSTVVYTIKICSDPECQKIVDGQLHKEKIQRQVIKKEQEAREEIRKQNIARKKLQSVKN
ncbi:MAG TPA: hypothetical protein VFI61_04135 [Patescibacteria group bacterium]|nr:hypothetical protein [Patescibacteria group bacterium]